MSSLGNQATTGPGRGHHGAALGVSPLDLRPSNGTAVSLHVVAALMAISLVLALGLLAVGLTKGSSPQQGSAALNVDGALRHSLSVLDSAISRIGNPFDTARSVIAELEAGWPPGQLGRQLSDRFSGAQVRVLDDDNRLIYAADAGPRPASTLPDRRVDLATAEFTGGLDILIGRARAALPGQDAATGFLALAGKPHLAAVRAFGPEPDAGRPRSVILLTAPLGEQLLRGLAAGLDGLRLSAAPPGAATERLDLLGPNRRSLGFLAWQARPPGPNLFTVLAPAALALIACLAGLGWYFLRDLRRSTAGVYEASRKARISERVKSDFLVNMSRELRTPVNVVIGFSDIMARETFGALGHVNYKEYAANIRDCARQLLDEVNDILDLSALDAGTLRLKTQEVDLVCTARAVRQLVRARLIEAGISCTLDLPENLPAVVADRRGLKQMLLGLLSYGIETLPRGAHLTLGARRADDGALCLAVQCRAPDAPSTADRTARPTMSDPHLALVASLAELQGASMTISGAISDDDESGLVIAVTFPPAGTASTV